MTGCTGTRLTKLTIGGAAVAVGDNQGICRLISALSTIAAKEISLSSTRKEHFYYILFTAGCGRINHSRNLNSQVHTPLKVVALNKWCGVLGPSQIQSLERVRMHNVKRVQGFVPTDLIRLRAE